MHDLSDIHAGWVADLFDDGLLGPAERTVPEAVAAVDGLPLPLRDRRERATEDIIGWRALCGCGAWQGRTWLRVDEPGDHAPARRQLYCPSGRLSPDLMALILAEVDGHRHEMAALLPVQLAYHETTSAERRLAEAVRFVRASGASWEAVGQAVGAMSGDAAERRFGALPAEPLPSAAAGPPPWPGVGAW
ncbi:hypothetical protein ACWEQ0_17755 [Nocardia thailandica]